MYVIVYFVKQKLMVVLQSWFCNLFQRLWGHISSRSARRLAWGYVTACLTPRQTNPAKWVYCVLNNITTVLHVHSICVRLYSDILPILIKPWHARSIWVNYIQWGLSSNGKWNLFTWEEETERKSNYSCLKNYTQVAAHIPNCKYSKIACILLSCKLCCP